MVDITKLKSMVAEYKKPVPDYDDNRKRLRNLVTKYGVEVTAIATGFNENTVKQYIRNGRAPMISTASLDQAEVVLCKLRLASQ